MTVGTGIVTVIYKDGHSEQMSKEELNIRIGTLYLAQCLNNYNPTGSLSLAIGNYNWGRVGMIYHHMPYYYDITTSPSGQRQKNLNDHTTLPTETYNYITKFMAFYQLLTNPTYREQVLAQNETYRKKALSKFAQSN